KAIEYAKKFQPRLENIYKIGELPLSNNPIEQVIRLSTLVRKNSLFARSVDGAKASAIFYSLVQTAKLNGLDIFKYINYIFSLLGKRVNVKVGAYLASKSIIQALCTKYGSQNH